jgi:hypothetical protein
MDILGALLAIVASIFAFFCDLPYMHAVFWVMLDVLILLVVGVLLAGGALIGLAKLAS